jgi:hypothetical protein
VNLGDESRPSPTSAANHGRIPRRFFGGRNRAAAAMKAKSTSAVGFPILLDLKPL